jgi:hypothetical protein
VRAATSSRPASSGTSSTPANVTTSLVPGSTKAIRLVSIVTSALITSAPDASWAVMAWLAVRFDGARVTLAQRGAGSAMHSAGQVMVTGSPSGPPGQVTAVGPSQRAWHDSSP